MRLLIVLKTNIHRYPQNPIAASTGHTLVKHLGQAFGSAFGSTFGSRPGKQQLLKGMWQGTACMQMQLSMQRTFYVTNLASSNSVVHDVDMLCKLDMCELS